MQRSAPAKRAYISRASPINIIMIMNQRTATRRACPTRRRCASYSLLSRVSHAAAAVAAAAAVPLPAIYSLSPRELGAGLYIKRGPPGSEHVRNGNRRE